MTSYMLKSELDAICVKHKHQWLEGMVIRNVMVINAVEEARDRAIRNFMREIVRRNMNELFKAVP